MDFEATEETTVMARDLHVGDRAGFDGVISSVHQHGTDVTVLLRNSRLHTWEVTLDRFDLVTVFRSYAQYQGE